MRKIANRFLAGFACLLLFCMTAIPVKAEGSLTVTERATTDEGAVLYVKGMTGSYDEVSFQVGTTAGTVDSVVPVNGTEESIHTLILWDNSLSVMNKCADEVKGILKDVVANRAPNEEFAIATIDKEVTYVTDYTNDYASLKQIIDGIEGEDKDAYIIENLYEAIVSLSQLPDCGYKRIILISDGMDAMEIGYSREELDTLISKNPYPVYTIGVLSKGRQEELQNMFALSRATSAEYYYLDEIEDSMSVVRALSADYSVLQVKVSVPAEIQDGSTQNSQLTFVSGSETYTVTSQITLPFAKNEETAGTEVAGEEIAGTESAETPVSEETASGETDEETDEEADGETKTITLFGREFPLMLVIGVAAGVLVLIILIVVIIIVSCGKKKKAPEGNDYAKLDQQIKNERHNVAAGQPNMPAGGGLGNGVAPAGMAGGASAPAGGASAPAGGKKTQLLFGGAPAAPVTGNIPGQQGAHRITLVNTADSVKTYQCNMADKIILGRNPATCNLAIMDDAVSERHCEIGLAGGKFYVKDLGSSNGTYINGCRINANVMTEVKTGCILKLGRSDYRITVE